MSLLNGCRSLNTSLGRRSSGCVSSIQNARRQGKIMAVPTSECQNRCRPFEPLSAWDSDSPSAITSSDRGPSTMADMIIPATVIGSWSFPGWYEKFCADVRAHPELFGPADRDEAVRDAVRLAIDDQLRAGLDRITDGEMQRVDFNLGFYEYLDGLEPLPHARRWAAPAHDQRDRYRAVAPLSAPDGLGTRGRISPASGIAHECGGQGAGARPVHAGRLHRRRRRLSRSQRASPMP